MRSRQWEQIEQVIPDILEIQKEPLPIYKRDWLTGNESPIVEKLPKDPQQLTREQTLEIQCKLGQLACVVYLTDELIPFKEPT